MKPDVLLQHLAETEASQIVEPSGTDAFLAAVARNYALFLPFSENPVDLEITTTWHDSKLGGNWCFSGLIGVVPESKSSHILINQLGIMLLEKGKTSALKFPESEQIGIWHMSVAFTSMIQTLDQMIEKHASMLEIAHTSMIACTDFCQELPGLDRKPWPQASQVVNTIVKNAFHQGTKIRIYTPY